MHLQNTDSLQTTRSVRVIHVFLINIYFFTNIKVRNITLTVATADHVAKFLRGVCVQQKCNVDMLHTREMLCFPHIFTHGSHISALMVGSSYGGRVIPLPNSSVSAVGRALLVKMTSMQCFVLSHATTTAMNDGSFDHWSLPLHCIVTATLYCKRITHLNTPSQYLPDLVSSGHPQLYLFTPNVNVHGWWRMGYRVSEVILIWNWPMTDIFLRSASSGKIGTWRGTFSQGSCKQLCIISSSPLTYWPGWAKMHFHWNYN